MTTFFIIALFWWSNGRFHHKNAFEFSWSLQKQSYSRRCSHKLDSQGMMIVIESAWATVSILDIIVLFKDSCWCWYMRLDSYLYMGCPSSILWVTLCLSFGHTVSCVSIVTVVLMTILLSDAYSDLLVLFCFRILSLSSCWLWLGVNHKTTMP